MTNLFNEIDKLKRILRKGWVQRSACKERYESDAEHIFSTCILALELINKKQLNLNTEKVLKMILYHEMGEIDVGDITPVDNVTLSEKYALEKQAVQRIAKESEMPEIFELWLEFEENKTPEARFVKKMDKLDAILQSQIYSKEIENDALFEEFYATSKHIVEDFDDVIQNKM